MLAERFQTAADRLTTTTAERQQARAARDAFIAANWPALDAAFVALVQTVSGLHPKLAIVTTLVTDTFTNRGFATLDKTVTEIRSTLYSAVEIVRFVPALESAAVNQFGVIKVETVNVTPRLTSDAQGVRFRSILDHGIVLEGNDVAAMSVLAANRYEPLTAALLEEFLAALLVRTE